MCEALNINSVKLNKPRKIKEYDERSRDMITHVLFSHLTIQDHIESLTLIMITHFDQQNLILGKS